MGRVPSLVGRIALLASILFLLFPPARAQETGSSAPADLDQVVQQADTIVRGHVVSVRSEPHPQFPSLRTIVVTFQADRILKGTADKTVTFRQYVFDGRDPIKTSGYQKADELLLFLNPLSRYGLTSPVGLDQGRFRIERDPQGNAFALNGRGNVGLFNNVETKARARGTTLSPRARAMVSAPPAGRVSLDTLEETVLALTQGQR